MSPHAIIGAQHELGKLSASMTHWRIRVGEKLLQESLRIAFDEKALKINQLKRIVVDTTVSPILTSPYTSPQS